VRGWWATHEYSKRSVSRDIEEFPGWATLLRLVDACETGLERAFIASLFSCGSRVSEALQLCDHHFEAASDEGLLIVRGAPLLKRYKKLEEQPGGGWVTEPIDAVRRSFPVLLAEPLAPFVASWVKEAQGYLFPSPRNRGCPLSRFWAYKLITRLGEATDVECWPHAFRSWRASQLVSDYGFEVMDLVDFFSWEKSDMALHYSRRGACGLARKMKPVHYL